MNTNDAKTNPPFTLLTRLKLVITVVLFVACLMLEMLPGKWLPPILAFVALGVVALILTPFVLGLPYGRKSFKEYCYDIRLLPVAPVGRNIAIGLLVACLTLSSIYLASLLTGHFQLDWSTVPPLRLVKGLTRGIWEEVFFRGIIFAILLQKYNQRSAVIWISVIFAVAHLSGFTLDVVVDLISLFFMGLLFIYIVLKTGSLLPAIVFHYVHDIFINLVQVTPGAENTMKLILLYAFFWTALAAGALLTKLIVERFPSLTEIPDQVPPASESSKLVGE